FPLHAWSCAATPRRMRSIRYVFAREAECQTLICHCEGGCGAASQPTVAISTQALGSPFHLAVFRNKAKLKTQNALAQLADDRPLHYSPITDHRHRGEPA